MIEVKEISPHLCREWLNKYRIVTIVGSRPSVDEAAIRSEAKSPKRGQLGYSYPKKN